ncbi:DapH/DapD/GlmU-related protein [Streptococcus parauberis]|nr:DapH/DapD/GlmU-related protein [Streptococcus parauberis]
MVDDTRITIGSHTMIGPNVTLIAGTHPLETQLRKEGYQYNLPVFIGENSWLGANVTVLPGVTIGNNVVVGANSLVTKDIPDNTLVMGSPAKIVTNLD